MIVYVLYVNVKCHMSICQMQKVTGQSLLDTHTNCFTCVIACTTDGMSAGNDVTIIKLNNSPITDTYEMVKL